MVQDTSSSMSSDLLENLYFDSNRQNGRINNVQDRLVPQTEAHTPRPLPQFFQQPQAFSTKKARGCTPRDSLPPRPPVKSAPPVSRIFPHKFTDKAQPVSFKNVLDHTLASPHYNECRKALYFDQCFEIDCKLGAGSFGEVFKVRSKEDGRFYAIKRSRERFRGESDRKRKLEEVAKHEQLPPHPNCVCFFKAWEENKHLYIQTELCKFSLRDYAELHHNIPERLVWNYFVDLLMAIKHLHEHDLVHMDIKPENIFLSDMGMCKLGDFGLVLSMAKDADYSEAQEGDPQYLAPELMQGKFGPPADVFSLGVTILELASDLDLPRGGRTWHQLRSGNVPEELLIGVSPELRIIIQLMMEPDPLKRPSAKEILERSDMIQIWKQRKRQQTYFAVVALLNTLLHAMWSLMFTLWLTMTYPLQSMSPEQPHTPTKGGLTHPPDWDHSFSDDDVYDEGISIHNNSMGAPLDYSSSSEEMSVRDGEGFVIPSVPARRIQTTPGLRPVPHRTYMSDAAGSPLLNSSGSIYSSSPVSSTASGMRAVPSFRDNESITPNSSFHRSLLEEIVKDELLDAPGDSKSNIEPKNLMDAFEGASSEED